MAEVSPVPLLSIADMAKRSGVSPHQLRQGIRRGELPFVRLGNKLFVPADSLTPKTQQYQVRHGS